MSTGIQIVSIFPFPRENISRFIVAPNEIPHDTMFNLNFIFLYRESRAIIESAKYHEKLIIKTS